MHHHHHTEPGHRNIRLAFFLNLTFTVIELVGGIWTNSAAILSDALHDLGDSLSLGVAWYFQKLSTRSSDHRFTYGYRRFSVLGAIINSLVLITGSAVILIETIPRLIRPETPNAQGMIYLAIGGLIFNGIAAYRMTNGHSLNERAMYLHLLEDVLGWAATLLAAIIIEFTGLVLLDPVLAILIALFILFNVYKNLRKALKIILQATPEGIDPQKIHNDLRSISEVEDAHDCHIWSMDGNYHILSIHLVLHKLDNEADLMRIKSRAKEILKDHGVDHSTIEFEVEKEHCDPC